MPEVHGVSYRDVSKYRFELTEPFLFYLPEVFWDDDPDTHDLGYIILGPNFFVAKHGYAWDGASGPTIDGPSTLRPSLVHDVLYQLMRVGVLPMSLKGAADSLFRQLLREDGMSAFRAWYWWLGLKAFGRPVSEPPK